MSVIEAVFLGLIQGLTEFLPISSSGHLVIFQTVLGIDNNSADLMFDSLLHIGTLFAVFIAFGSKIKELVSEAFSTSKQIVSGKLQFKSINSKQRMLFSLFISLIPLLFIFPIKEFIEKTYSSIITVGIALIFTSILLFLCDKIFEGNTTEEDLTVKKSLVVGIVQAFAVIPGISRSGFTITAGIMCGFNRKLAVQYSFLLSIPTIIAGALLNIIDAINVESVNTSLLIPYMIGMATAAISGYASLKLLQFLLKNKKFIIFSIYCLAVGVFSIIYGLT